MSKVKFYIGDADSHTGWPGYVMLEVDHIADGYARGKDGTCAFCQGDPCAEDSPPESQIAQYFARNREYWIRSGARSVSCPCCDGRPT